MKKDDFVKTYLLDQPSALGQAGLNRLIVNHFRDCTREPLGHKMPMIATRPDHRSSVE